MPFAARALKNHFLWRWYCSKKKGNAVFRSLYSYRRERVITLFPNIFSYCLQLLHVKRVCRSFWKETLTCTSLQNATAHFQVRVGVINSRQILTMISFVLNTNRIWFKRCLYSNRQIYALSQLSKFVVDSLGCASWVHDILTTVMTPIVLDKNTDHVKPHWICQIEYTQFKLEWKNHTLVETTMAKIDIPVSQ